MTYALRSVRLLIVLALMVGAIAGTTSSATASSGDATAAALKKCKAGWNKKKCRCPASKKRIKRDGRYRCKRRATTTDPNQTPGTDPGTGTTPDPGTGTGEVQQPPAGVQPVRDDAGFEAVLNSSLLRKYEEGTYGYGRYAYNFLGDHQFLYCSYYYASSTVEANRAGTWQVEEGYTVPGYPGYAIGRVRIIGSDFNVAIGVEMYGNQSNVATGNASSTFTEGAFTRAIGGAVTNCSAIQ